MAKTDYISQRRLDQFWDNAKDYIGDEMGRVITHSDSEKEVVRILTVSDVAPENPENGDLFIDTSDQTLCVWDSEEENWFDTEASKYAVYVAADTNNMYLWDGTAFVDVTGEKVGSTLYVNNLTTDLEWVTTKGVYDVILSKSTGVEVYTLVVTVKEGGPVRPGRPRITLYSQVLQNYRGYMTRTKYGAQSWTEWHEFQYVIEPMDNNDIDNLFE